MAKKSTKIPSSLSPAPANGYRSQPPNGTAKNAPSPRAPIVRDEMGNGPRLDVLPLEADRFWQIALAILIVTIVLRQLWLAAFPYHPDEAIHAWFSSTLR